MIYILESITDEVKSLLGDQGYTVNDIVNDAISYVSDPNTYYGIYLALDSDRSEEARSSISSFVTDYILPEIARQGDSYEYDYSELVSDMVDSDEGKAYFGDLNRSYDDLVWSQRSSDRRDRDYDIKSTRRILGR